MGSGDMWQRGRSSGAPLILGGRCFLAQRGPAAIGQSRYMAATPTIPSYAPTISPSWRQCNTDAGAVWLRQCGLDPVGRRSWRPRYNAASNL